MPKKQQRFADTYKELQEVAEWFENDSIDIEEGIKQFERGMALASQCRQKLEEVEQRIVTIKNTFAN